MTPIRLRDARAAMRKVGQGIDVKPHQGEREKRRRRAQMTAGQLHAILPDTVQPVEEVPVAQSGGAPFTFF